MLSFKYTKQTSKNVADTTFKAHVLLPLKENNEVGKTNTHIHTHTYTAFGVKIYPPIYFKDYIDTVYKKGNSKIGVLSRELDNM